MKTHLLFLASFLAPYIVTHAAGLDLATNDEALIAHIKKTDYVFKTALSHCSNEKIERNLSGDKKQFKLTAHCSAVAAEESDCPGYKIIATGTIDTENWATLRSTTLELECHG